MLAAVARAPTLAGAQPLVALEQAFLVGATSAERVAAAYAAQPPAEGGDPLWAASQWDAGARASAYVAVRAQGDPAARAALLDAAWQGARGAERFLVAAVVRAAVHRAAGRASARGGRTERGAGAARGRAAGSGGRLAVAADRSGGHGPG